MVAAIDRWIDRSIGFEPKGFPRRAGFPNDVPPGEGTDGWTDGAVFGVPVSGARVSAVSNLAGDRFFAVKHNDKNFDASSSRGPGRGRVE